MTKLTRPVRRVSSGTIRERGRSRDIIVILRPPNVLGFRLAGCRHEYALTVEGCYTMAVRATIARERMERVKAKKRAVQIPL